MKKGIFSFMVLALLALLMAAPPAMAQGQPSAWNYLRANTPTGKVIVDTMVINKAAKTTDTSAAYYFNDLVPYGSIYVSLISYRTGAGLLKPPRIELAMLDNTLKPYKPVKYARPAVLREVGWTSGDTGSSYRDAMEAIAVKLDTIETSWRLISDTLPASFTMTLTDTFRYVIPYDFREFQPYAVKFRALVAVDSLKAFIKMTGTSPTNKTQLNY
jgi:hypothetical protein